VASLFEVFNNAQHAMLFGHCVLIFSA